MTTNITPATIFIFGESYMLDASGFGFWSRFARIWGESLTALFTLPPLEQEAYVRAMQAGAKDDAGNLIPAHQAYIKALQPMHHGQDSLMQERIGQLWKALHHEQIPERELSFVGDVVAKAQEGYNVLTATDNKRMTVILECIGIDQKLPISVASPNRYRVEDLKKHQGSLLITTTALRQMLDIPAEYLRSDSSKRVYLHVEPLTFEGVDFSLGYEVSSHERFAPDSDLDTIENNGAIARLPVIGPSDKTQYQASRDDAELAAWLKHLQEKNVPGRYDLEYVVRAEHTNPPIILTHVEKGVIDAQEILKVDKEVLRHIGQGTLAYQKLQERL